MPKKGNKKGGNFRKSVNKKRKRERQQHRRQQSSEDHNRNHQRQQNRQGEWNKLSLPNTATIRQKLMMIGQSIWLCTDSYGYEAGAKGVIRYDTSSHDYVIIPYPKFLGEISEHSCCNYEHLIYIVNGKYGNLIIFNTETKQFIQTIEIPEFGGGVTSIMINQQLHVFNGNTDSYLIIDTSTKKLKQRKDINREIRALEHVINHNNQIIRFGGCISDSVGPPTDDFVICDLNGNHTGNYKLPIPLRSAGYIKWREYLIIMGGITTVAVDKNGIPNAALRMQYTDDIYILNLDNSMSPNKWIKSKTKCPMKISCHAILTKNEMVHIIEWVDCDPSHFSIHISTILGDLYHERQEEINADCDETNSIDAAKRMICFLAGMSQDSQFTEQKQSECEIAADKLKQMEINNKKLKQLTKQFSETKTRQKAKIESLKKQNHTLQQKNDEYMEMNGKLSLEVQELKIANHEYQVQNDRLMDECKQLQSSLNETKHKLAELQRSKFDPSRYLEWNSDDLALWICSLDNKKYIKYKDKLLIAFRGQGVDGKNIQYLDKTELKGFGVDAFVDRGAIYQHIQSLIKNKINENPAILQEIEGQDSTNYMQ